MKAEKASGGKWGPAISKEEGPKMVVGKKMSPAQGCLCMRMSHQTLLLRMLTKTSGHKTKCHVVLYYFQRQVPAHKQNFLLQGFLLDSSYLGRLLLDHLFFLLLVLRCSQTIPLHTTSNSACHPLLE